MAGLEAAVAPPQVPAGGSAGAILNAHALEYRHGSHVTLRGIDISLRPSEVVGVIGPNGAGKTTLLRLLGGLNAPAMGSLTWLGGSQLTRQLRRQIGYLPDQAALFDELTGLENLLLFATVRKIELTTDAAHTLASVLGLAAEQLAARAATYSFGMRRKLALAQTLVGDPRLLLLDEPTLGLDAEARDLLGARLRSNAARTPVLLASNDLGFAEEYCDRVVFLAQGAVVLEGEPARLLAPLQGQAGFRVTLRQSYHAIRKNDLEVQSIDERNLLFRSPRGAESLPGLVAALISAGNEIENIGVRRADLSDVFRRLTGSEWETR